MKKTIAETLHGNVQPISLAAERSAVLARNIALVISASIFMALCAHVSVPLLFTPVPLTLQTFALPLLAMLLGPRRAATAMALYLVEGASGFPVFSPAGPGGLAQLLGPTGGFLMTYPLAAFATGSIFERGGRSMTAGVAACTAGISIVFSGAISWLVLLTHKSLLEVAALAFFPYVPGEILKIAAASALAARWFRHKK